MNTKQDRLKPLKRDIRFLGQILGQMLQRFGAQNLLQEVEKLRHLAKEVRRGAGSEGALVARLERHFQKMDPTTRHQVAKAFTEFLRLANIAEQQHRVRRRLHYESVSPRPQPGSIEATLQGLKPAQKRELKGILSHLQIDLVLTAHPTETQKRSAIRRYKRIAQALGDLEDPKLSRWKRIQVHQEMEQHIQALWLTDVVPESKPTPLAEARFGTSVVEETLWEALPELYRKLDYFSQRFLGEGLPIDSSPLIFSSWIGGDRDGNPFVTAEVTRQILFQSLKQALNLYQAELNKLVEDFSFSQASPRLLAKVKSPTEPYRQIFLDLIERLKETRSFLYTNPRAFTDAPQRALRQVNDLLEPLKLCQESLCEVGALELANGRLIDLIRRLRGFGLVLLPLDIRQSADVHSEAVADLCRKLLGIDYLVLSEKERQKFLLGQIKKMTRSRRPVGEGLHLQGADLQEMTQEVLQTCRLLEEFPRGSFRSYIIAMAEQASHVLEVWFLMSWAGVKSPPQLVPLLETPESLDRAPKLMKELFSHSEYRQHIHHHQQVMIGYSDSAKRSGRLSASWTLYRAQEELEQLGRDYSVQMEFFHGRGGSIGRGGGPIHLALQSQPQGLSSPRLRITEQGESIEAKFGLPEIAGRTLELYVSGVMESHLAKGKKISSLWSRVMQELAEDSAQAFRSRIEQDPHFLPHYLQITPLEELSFLKIGSRPKKRKKQFTLESLRAIPWIFSWTQNRSLLPSWLGVGEALERQITEGRLTELQKMYSQWPFFRATMDLIEMVLAKADPAIVRYYSKVLVEDALQRRTQEDLQSYQRAVKAVLAVTGHRQLLEGHPVLRRSIDVRTPYVDVLNVLQAQLLLTHRQHKTQGASVDAQLEKTMALTISGISAGMRNTG